MMAVGSQSNKRGREGDPAPLSWKPVRYGSRYCAPACGSGCTVEDYEAAKRAGTAIARQLGPDWKVRLNENMGWFYSAFLRFEGGQLNVHPQSRKVADGKGGWKTVVDGYFTLLGDARLPTAGQPEFSGDGRTPLLAVESTLRKVRARRAWLNRALAALDAGTKR